MKPPVRAITPPSAQAARMSRRSAQLPGDDIRIDEDTRADDASHDDHGGVEQA
jgi:hypothetical protein